jgi:hypothetical protein
MTDVILTSGGRPTQSTEVISADQITIVGNGTTDLPLRAGSGGSTFVAAFLGDVDFPPKIGQPISVGGGSDPTVGICNVVLTIGLPVAGVIVGLRDVVVDGESVTATVDIQSAAVVTLTETEWDEVTGGSGGLTPGSAYYLHPATLGTITTTKPAGIGEVVAQLGVAITTTQLAVYLPVVPITNL